MFKIIQYNIKLFTAKWTRLIFFLVVFALITGVKVAFESDSTILMLMKQMSSSIFFLKESFLVNVIFFVSTIIFVGVVINAIYKSPKENGSSLLLIEKPFSKAGFIYGNLLSIGILITGFAASIFVIDFSTSLIVGGDTGEHALESTSIFIGTIVIAFIFASFLLIISLFLSSKGLHFVALGMGLLAPLTSIVISVVGNTELTRVKTYTYGDRSMDDAKNIYLDQTGKSGEYFQTSELEGYNNDLYGKLVYVDPWYQLSGLYSIFSKDSEQSGKWIKETKTIAGDFKIGLKSYKILYSSGSISKDRGLHYSALVNKIVATPNKVSIFKNEATDINNMTFEKQMILMNWIIENGTINLTSSKFTTELNIVKALTQKESQRKFAENNVPSSFSLLTKLKTISGLTIGTTTDIQGTQFDNLNANALLVDDKYSIKTFKKISYLNNNYILLFWLLISLLMFGVVQIIEFKKDSILH